MIKKILDRFLELLPLIFLSLVPIFWFEPEHIINQNDTTFPLDPVAFFKQRFYTWNSSFGLGINYSFDTTGIFFHGLQALIYKLGFSITDTQKIFVCLWFFFLSTAAFYFSKTILGKTRRTNLINYIGVIFYLFNPFLFNVWSNINAASLAGLFFVPAITSWVVDAVFRETKISKKILILTIICFLGSAIGVNPPLFLVVGLYLFLLFFSLFFYSFTGKKVKFKKVLSSLIVFCLFFSLFNAYWILPELVVIRERAATNIPKASELKTWLDTLSLHSSIFNLIKLQGDWVWWYPGYLGEKFVTYADKYLTNPFLIIVSFIAPLLVILSFVFVRRKIIVFAGVLLFFGLVFSSGSHLPLGAIFLFIASKVPFFRLIKSPWYKFSLLTNFGYLICIILFFKYLFEKEKKWLTYVGILLTLGRKIYLPHFNYGGYFNGWKVEPVGEYEIIIEDLP